MSNASQWTVPREKLDGISVIDHLWNRLSGIYGGRWLKDFPTPESIENWKTAWVEVFEDERLTPHEVAAGLRACRRAYDWPPSMAEFIKVCRPGLIPENAFHDAVAGMSARRRGEHVDWSHPAVYWAAVRVGSHDLLNCGYSVMQSRWERALSEELARGEWAPVPAPAVALPAPIKPTEDGRKAAEQVMRQVGAGALLSEQGKDQRRWAKKILDEMQRAGGRRYSPAVVAMAKAAIKGQSGRQGA